MGHAGVMPQLPTPLRAAIGLAAAALDEARTLPDKAIELPMLAVSTALQMSLRAQQRYAQLAARGDEIVNHREPTDEPPPWATFDEPVAMEQTGYGAVNGTARRAADLDAALDATAPEATAPEATAPAAGPAAAPEHEPEPPTQPPAQPEPEPEPEPGPEAERKAVRKTVRRPRNAAPSAFDAVGDD